MNIQSSVELSISAATSAGMSTATAEAPYIPSSGRYVAEQPAYEPVVDTQAVDPDELTKAVQELQESSQALNRELDFSVDKDSGKFVVKVIDKSTDKVVREIPPKEVLKIAAWIKKIVGVLFDETA